MRLLPYVVAGVYFGVVATQAQIISWYRIQEMFRFESFHMYGILGSAVVVGALSVQVIKRFRIKSLGGETVEIPPKAMERGHRYWVGGTLFGLGWGLVGSCPGPIFALLGHGVSVMVVVLASAMLGTWSYAVLRTRLPH